MFIRECIYYRLRERELDVPLDFLVSELVFRVAELLELLLFVALAELLLEVPLRERLTDPLEDCERVCW